MYFKREGTFLSGMEKSTNSVLLILDSNQGVHCVDICRNDAMIVQLSGYHIHVLDRKEKVTMACEGLFTGVPAMLMSRSHHFMTYVVLLPWLCYETVLMFLP